jgi:putative ABC transport system permease protein
LGLGIGLVAALALTRWMSGMLFSVRPADPVALGGAAALLMAVALVAIFIPARRAARLNPMEALRYE